MTVIKPFTGTRYNTAKAGSLTELVTPPYDVINEEQKSCFLEQNQYNIVRLDIPKAPGHDNADNQNRHRQAAELLSSWMRDGVLIREQKDSIYPYDVHYRLSNGITRTRKGFICLVQLRNFSEGIIKPHEETFPTVIQDRLALTRACRAQFSQVFSVFSDPANQVIQQLDNHRGDTIAQLVDGDGNEHQLWRISNEAVIASVQKLLSDKALYVADGHHRYTTALAYRDELGLSDGPESMIMMYLCPIEGSGLSILPTHRVVTVPAIFDLPTFLTDLSQFFDVEELHDGNQETLLQNIQKRINQLDSGDAEPVPGIFGLYYALEDRGFLLRSTPLIQTTLDKHPSSLRKLDVVLFNDVIITKLLGLELHRCEQERLITYHSDLADGLARCRKCVHDTPLFFLLNAATMNQVRAVSDAGLFMPHKSTYFYPKVVTGLVMNVFNGQKGRGNTTVD